MRFKLLAVVLFAWLSIWTTGCNRWGLGSSGYEGYTTGAGGAGPSCGAPMTGQGGAGGGGVGGAGGGSFGSGAGGATVSSGAGGGSFGSGAGGGSPGESPEGFGFCGSDVCAGQCPVITGGNSFDASDFVFVTTVPDDGQDGAGGWQQAIATLKFVRWTSTIFPQRWSCPVTVGMPIRSAAWGTWSASKAATVTAAIATLASENVTHETPDLTGVLFCSAFKDEMLSLFKMQFAGLGARVN
jgi:hypothetical protein